MIPILVLAAELDGLNRVSRFAESYYHTDVNINSQQKNKFTSVLIRGMNHAQFANVDSKQPDFIMKNDLKAERQQDDNLEAVANIITSKFSNHYEFEIAHLLSETKTFMATFIDAMQ